MLDMHYKHWMHDLHIMHIYAILLLSRGYGQYSVNLILTSSIVGYLMVIDSSKSCGQSTSVMIDGWR